MYVSDRPGKHNMELLKRMVLPDGNVLLCTQPGRPTLDCLFADCMRDKQSLLKVRPHALDGYWQISVTMRGKRTAIGPF